MEKPAETVKFNEKEQKTTQKPDKEPQKITKIAKKAVKIPEKVVFYNQKCIVNINGSNGSRKIAVLTFDDGPAPKVTRKILNILEENEIKATFFMLGYRVKEYPKIVQAAIDEGHEVASHSYTHKQLTKLSLKTVKKQLERTNAAFEEYGIEPKWFRPPYGSTNKRINKIAKDLGMKTILWDVDPKDWTKPTTKTLKQRVIKQTTSGSIILLHDIHNNTANSLPEIIKGLQDEGYEFMTLTEWLEHSQENLKKSKKTPASLC